MTRRRWFLPESPDLLRMLREQMAITIEGMNGLVAWSAGDTNAAHVVRECEHRADDAERALWRALQAAFSPPLDAEDLFTLSANLDEVLNASKDLVREMEVMNLQPDAATQYMAGLLADAVGHLDQAFACLGDRDEATRWADDAIKSQRRVEHVYRRAMSALVGTADVHDVIAWREVYRRLSRIGDLVRAVADRVWYSVVKES